MPKLPKNAPKKDKAKRISSEMHKFKDGKMHSGSKSGPKVENKKQAVAIALSEAGESKKKPKKSDDKHSFKMLEKHQHHESMAKKHRAHADLIEAKLRVQGKRIRHGYDGEPTKVVQDQ